MALVGASLALCGAAMQGLLKKLGFTQRGIIHVSEDNDPRYAYDLTWPEEQP